MSPALIMAALDADERRRLMGAIELKGADPGPCAACQTPTARMRPFVTMPPDSELLGMPPGESLLSVVYLCDRHDTEAEAGRFRARLIVEARERRRHGLAPDELPNLI